MTFYQPYLSHPGAQGAGRSPEAGYPPLTSQGYITAPSGQQYMQMPPTTFFPPQNLQRTYAELSPSPPPSLPPPPPSQHRIELNPNAVAYQSYTSPSPPLHNSQQYPGGGDPRHQEVYQTDSCQLYQERPKQYRGQPLFRPYQNGPEVVGLPPAKNHPQCPVTPHTLKSPIQTFNVPAPSLGGPSIPSTKEGTPNSLTRSYPDDHSGFVKDSGQGIAVPSTSAEELFKAKALVCGIEISTKAESLSNAGKGKHTKKLCSNKLSNGSDEINAEKPTEMLFQKTHIEPEHSNDSDDGTTVSSVNGESDAYSTIPKQSLQNCDTFSTNSTASEKKVTHSNDYVYEPSVYNKDMFYSEGIENQYMMSPVEWNGCVIYSEIAEHESEEKNNSTEISGNVWSKGSCPNSLDSTGECDSFITARDENVSSASDGEIGILGNYVLEALMPTKSPKGKKTDTVQEGVEQDVQHRECDTECLDQEHDNTLEGLVEAYIKTIIKKACEVVSKKCYSSGECGHAGKEAEKTDGEENNKLCHDKTTSDKVDSGVENLDLGVNFQKTKHENEADDLTMKHQNKSTDTKVKHQIDDDNSNAKNPDGEVDSISDQSSAGPVLSSWAMAWNTKSKSKDENSNYCSNNIAKVQEVYHDSSTEQSSDYSDSGSASQFNPISPEFKPRRYLKSKSLSVSTLRPDAPVFQPLNVQTLPLSVKRKLKEGSCQTEEKEYKEVASNTRRVKQIDRISETVSCDTREVCVNTMESCFTEDTEYFVAEERTYSEQSTLTESLDKKSIGVLVKPHALDACTVNKETMTEPVSDYLESLIATQRELLHLRGDVCTLELKRQIHELERSKQMFQNMGGEPLDKVMDDRITSLKIELNIIQNQVVSYDAHLLAGNVWKTVPRFAVSIPVGNQNIRTVNKDLNQKSSGSNMGTKRSFWDAYSSEEEHLLHGLETNRPAKMSSKDHYHLSEEHSSKCRGEALQLKPPQSFSFTSVNDSSLDSTKPGKIKDSREQEQTAGQKIKTEIASVTNPKADQAPVINMDDIDDDVSLPEFPKTPPLEPHHVSDNAAESGVTLVSDHVKQEVNVQSKKYTNSQALCKEESSPAMEIVSQTFDNRPVSDLKDSRKMFSNGPLFADDLSRPALSPSLSVAQNSKFTTFSNGPTSVMATRDNSFTAFSSGPTSVIATGDNNFTTFSSEPTSVSKTQMSSITTFSNGPTSVTAPRDNSFTTFSSGPLGVAKTQMSSITTSSNGPTTVSSVLTPLPISHIPSSSCNTTHSRGITSNQVQTSIRQNVASQLAPLITGLPLLATPRIIPGQQGVALFPQVHQANVTPYIQIRQPKPSLPPYPLVRQVQPSIVPYSQVLPQSSIPSYPLMRTSLLPQPQHVAKIPSSVYQGNPLFQSPQTERTSPSLGMLSGQGNVCSTAGQINASSVPIPTKSSIPLKQTSNQSGQLLNIPGKVNSTAGQGQREESLSVPSSNVTPCSVTSTIQTSKPSSAVKGLSVDPDLYQAVINQLRQAYPQMASDPVWLETVGAQQTLVLQNYIDASKNTAPNKDGDNTMPPVSNFSSNNSSLQSQSKEDSSKLHTYSKSKASNADISQIEVIMKQRSVIDEPCLTNNATEVPRRPPGLASLTETDNSLSQKFENMPDISMKDLNGGAKGLVKTISNLTKLTGNESKDISPNEQRLAGDDRTVVHKSSVESKLSQKPKSLLDNFKRVENPVVHEPKVSTLYPDTFEKQDHSILKDMDLNTIHSNHSRNRSKSIPSRQMPTAESDKASREALRYPSPKSQEGENWEKDVEQDPKPFRHDFRKVRPAEKTKASWMSEMVETNVPPGLPLKKPVEKTKEGMNKEGTSGMSVILASKGLKTTGDLDKHSDGESENWHQVSKKKKEKKKCEPERPRRKSGSDAPSSKSNNFEKLITKMSEVFSTLSRERIIQLITEVRNETKGLSGMNMKQIIDLSRQVFLSKRHYYQSDPKQRHSSGGSPTPNAQKANKPAPLPIVGMAPMPGPGKTFNFKPLSMSVIQPSKDLLSMDDEEEICVICHDALSMEEIKVLECGHVFHSDCIKQWVYGQERTCPNCRRLALFPEEFPRLGK